MKPFAHIAELAPVKPQAIVAKPALKRVWIKVEGKLECRWTEDQR